MGFVIVLAIAVAVGLLVYRITDPGDVAMDTAPPEPDGLGEPGASVTEGRRAVDGRWGRRPSRTGPHRDPGETVRT